MNIRRILTFSKRTLLQFRHDRRTLAFVIVMPLLMIVIFGYTFGGDVKGVTVQIVNKDTGAVFGIPPGNRLILANNITDHLDTNTLKIITEYNESAARASVDDANAWAAIIFPENFSENFQWSVLHPDSPRYPTVEVYCDASNPTITAAVLKSVNQAIQDTMGDFSQSLKITQARLPISVSTAYAYGGGDTQFIDYFAPGVISFAIMMVTTIITIILFVNERRNGTLQRLLASPASEGEIVIGYSLAFGLIGLLQSIVVLVAAILLFNIVIVGSIFLALFVVLLIAFGHQGLGILLSAGARNELQAVQFIPLILFPSILLAGLFWPVESIPSYLQPLSYIIPLRYGIDAERAIMLRGWGLAQIWVDVAFLIGFAVLTLFLSTLLLKRKK
jgi:ABC-2 type transport system permease protein